MRFRRGKKWTQSAPLRRLIRLILDLDSVHRRIVAARYERDHQFALRIWFQIVKRHGKCAVGSAGLFEDIEISTQSNAIALDIEDSAPFSAASRPAWPEPAFSEVERQ